MLATKQKKKTFKFHFFPQKIAGIFLKLSLTSLQSSSSPWRWRISCFCFSVLVCLSLHLELGWWASERRRCCLFYWLVLLCCFDLRVCVCARARAFFFFFFFALLFVCLFVFFWLLSLMSLSNLRLQVLWALWLVFLFCEVAFSLRDWLIVDNNREKEKQTNKMGEVLTEQEKLGARNEQAVKPLVFAYYVTGHGLGHATRVIEVWFPCLVLSCFVLFVCFHFCFCFCFVCFSFIRIAIRLQLKADAWKL